MRILIATITCHRDDENGRLDGIRKTWHPLCQFLGMDHAFCFANGALDDYNHVQFKVRHACEFALAHRYDFLFVSDTDTYINVAKLYANHPEPDQDYVGWRCDGGHAAGGNGYWLNRRAMKVIADTPAGEGHQDIWVGKALAAAGIHVHHDSRYVGGNPSPDTPNVIAAHLGRGTNDYDPQWMIEFHAKQS